MRKRVAVSAVVTVDPIKPRKPLENFLFVFSHPGEGGVQMARAEVQSPETYTPHPNIQFSLIFFR